MRRWWAPLLVVVAGGCAYYNGIYNSKSAAGYADRQVRRGESYAARDSFLQSAAKAESVLKRHPKTRWRDEAVYLAGRGFAMAGECGRALPRLDEYLALSAPDPMLRDRAIIARSACLLQNNQLLAADALVRSVLEHADPDIRAEAAYWGGRVAMALGDAERAQDLLARVPGSVAAWEFMTAAFAQANLTTAESLLTSRAVAGDWRSEVSRHVSTLWASDRQPGAVRIVNLYGRSRAPMTDRVELHLLASDLAAAAGDTALARTQANEAARAGVTPAVEAKVQSRLLALRIRELDLLSDVEAAVRRDSANARGTLLLQRIRDNLLFVRLLYFNPDRFGSHVYLAAEIFRDSLQAKRLAHATFRSMDRDFPDSPMTGRALLAAGAVFPESAAVYRARVQQRWNESVARGDSIPVLYAAALIAGRADFSRTTQRIEDVSLQRVWDFASRQFADTVKERRRADSVAAAGRVIRQ